MAVRSGNSKFVCVLGSQEQCPDRAANVRAVRDWFVLASTLRVFLKAEYGKVISKWDIEKLLSNPFYIGTYAWEGKSYAGLGRWWAGWCN